MKNEIIENFGGILRVRVCGILLESQGLLLVCHQGVTNEGDFWSPPGGGMRFGQSAADCLKQEFLEETGLEIAVGELLFVNEFHGAPFHALELFFMVERTGGKLVTGYDPELTTDQQIIKEARYFKTDDFQRYEGAQLHAVLRNIRAPEQVLNLKGYFHNSK
jgi:8-oxo-dGTP diphosphatase